MNEGATRSPERHTIPWPAIAVAFILCAAALCSLVAVKIPSLPLRAYLGFFLNAGLYTALGAAGYGLVRRFAPAQAGLFSTLRVGALVALLGYVAFWLYFAHPLAGRIYSWGVLVIAAGLLWMERRREGGRDAALGGPVLLAGAIGAFYIAMLLAYGGPAVSNAAAHRFVTDLPIDNEIPRFFAERLWNGQSPKQMLDDWLSSDRPPLQTGWVLLTWPILKPLGIDIDTATTTAGMCFQLFWVFAAWELARYMGFSRAAAYGVATAIAFTGIMMIFSVFVWPKLGAASLTVAAYLWWRGEEKPTPVAFALGGLCAALGWLAHGGVAFSLIALVVVALGARWRFTSRHVFWAAGAFFLCALPWLLYQKLYEPPGNRLLKWHLAGVIPSDPRGFLETLGQSYREAGLTTVLAHKWSNVQMQVSQMWPLDYILRPGNWNGPRNSEFFLTARSLGLWVLALLIIPLGWRKKSRSTDPAVGSRRGELLGWLIAGFAVWLVLMFLPNSAAIHQGSQITQILLFTLLATGALSAQRVVFFLLTIVQAVWCTLVWFPPDPTFTHPLDPTMAILAALLGVGLLGFVGMKTLRSSPWEAAHRTQ